MIDFSNFPNMTPEERKELMKQLASQAPKQTPAVYPNTHKLMELRKAVQLFLSTMDADTQLADMMEVATVFPKYKVGKTYKAKEVFSYGENGVGDPQLYMSLQAHTSAEQWPPDATPSLYKKIGVTADGYPEWVQPLGVPDAYNAGDIVSYNGTLHRSLIDANTTVPGTDVRWWEEV